MKLTICALAALLGTTALVQAQNTFDTPQTPSGGPRATGVMQMCPNASGQAVACGGQANPIQITGPGGGGSIGNVTIAPSKSATPYTAATVGTADSTILAANTVTNWLDLVNNSPTATLCINFGAAATISTTTCAAGEITIPPLWHRSWPDGGVLVPTGAVHGIASAASTPASVGAN